MKAKTKRPKISQLQESLSPQLQEYLHLTRLAEMGRLAAQVAHEINNPLMVAQGFAENIELLLANEKLDRGEVRIQILEIIKACHRMNRIVGRMNRMSRNQKLRLVTVDLAEVALHAVDFLRQQMLAQQIHVDFKFKNPMPVRCDALQIEQILLNILGNAIYAVEQIDGPRIIRISFEHVGKKWHQIKIWNNGPTIPDAVQANMMRPFFTTKEAGQGTGLGLAVSRAIMEVHRGDLSFQSSPELGTEFRLSFPRPRLKTWTRAQTQKSAGWVVVIDRQENNRLILRERLRLLGFQVMDFNEAEDSISLITSGEPIAGVLIDVIPGQSESADFIQFVRHTLGPASLVFALSHWISSPGNRNELISAGATDVFEKPINAEQFALMVRQLDRSQTQARTSKKALLSVSKAG